MGRNGRAFTLLKFRSMVVTRGAGARITVCGDRRITAVGAFLRRYKLDELPQFWNVLRGDMALVGPRPKLAQHEALVLGARPGITGPATLLFRNEELLLAQLPSDQVELIYHNSIKPEKARLDSEYLREATLLSDCRVLIATVAACLRPAPSASVPREDPSLAFLLKKHPKADSRLSFGGRDSFDKVTISGSIAVGPISFATESGAHPQ